jgi:predicted MPP superfamily phosphohydrolase
MAVFLIVFLSLWTVLHLYVGWRLWSLPWVATHVPRWALLAGLAVLALSYILARTLDRQGFHRIAHPLEYLGADWMGIVFLLGAALLAAEVVTGFGFLLPRIAPTVRSGAVVIAGALALIAIVQGVRDPVVVDYEVSMAGLPRERDGLVVVELSDLHLGTLIGERWMARQVARVNALKPDLVVVVGDLVDGNVGAVEPLLPLLRELRAPLGIWAVTGNHEFYAGIERCVRLFDDAGFHVLRDASAEIAPGLVLAGVDDLTGRRQFNLNGEPVKRALAGRPPGATVFLCHSPWKADLAASAGVDLMLCGHTHDGQIWPFGYFVKPIYPLMGGRYAFNGMPVIVGRGAGTWGPRMRLWRPSEIVRITLHSADPAHPS